LPHNRGYADRLRFFAARAAHRGMSPTHENQGTAAGNDGNFGNLDDVANFDVMSEER
jgi:hypothetical protein